jgi:hypothetical protein
MQSAHYIAEPQQLDYGGGVMNSILYSAQDSVGGNVDGYGNNPTAVTPAPNPMSGSGGWLGNPFGTGSTSYRYPKRKSGSGQEEGLPWWQMYPAQHSTSSSAEMEGRGSHYQVSRIDFFLLLLIILLALIFFYYKRAMRDEKNP